MGKCSVLYTDPGVVLLASHRLNYIGSLLTESRLKEIAFLFSQRIKIKGKIKIKKLKKIKKGIKCMLASAKAVGV